MGFFLKIKIKTLPVVRLDTDAIKNLILSEIQHIEQKKWGQFEREKYEQKLHSLTDDNFKKYIVDHTFDTLLDEIGDMDYFSKKFGGDAVSWHLRDKCMVRFVMREPYGLMSHISHILIKTDVNNYALIDAMSCLFSDHIDNR
jgi:hypothetical protein